MLSSIPVPFQAILWPLAGAAVILVLSRWLPNGVRRLLAMAAALASWMALWSLRTGTVERVELFWEPLNFFRMSPVLYADGLSLLSGLLLAGVTAAVVLGIRGSESQKTVWHGLVLIALAGCLAMAMAANLLALALGSALIDLALIAIAVSGSNEADVTGGLPLSMAVPGLAATVILFLGALQMDAQAGHASLLSLNLPEGALVLVGVAGVLRSFVFPLHPRRLGTPESAVTVLLPVGAGGFLLIRVQALAPVLTGQAWLMAAAALALLAGGLLAWSGGLASMDRQPLRSALGGFWPGILVHQTGYVLAFVLLLAGVTPWPVVSLMLALGALAIWWGGSHEKETASRPRWLTWVTRQTSSWWARARLRGATRFPGLGRWGDFRFGQRGMVVLVAIALASLAGAPLTIGARARWSTYAAWLRNGDPTLLIALAADAFLVAGLWIAVRATWQESIECRPSATALLAMVILVIPVLVLGVAPGILRDELGLGIADLSGVSRWGLGLLYVLPWFLGAWLARLRSPLRNHLDRVRDVVNLDWFYRGAGWVGHRLAGAVYWLGQVGEGEGWWGWVLIVLALGVILFLAR